MIRRGRTLLAGSLAVVLIAALAAAGCGGDDDSGAGETKPNVRLASKGFPESDTITQAYKQALEARGYTVDLTSLASTALADGAIRNGDIDMYSEYTTTILADVLKVAAPPTDVQEQVAQIKAKYEPEGLTVLDAAPFNNDNEVACTKEAVDQNQLTTLTSLAAAAPKLVYSANPEHTTRPDGLPLLVKEYGIKFKDVVQVDINLRYRPVEDGKAQCVYAFGTDPNIAANDLVVLEDDKGKFGGAPYQGIPVVTKKLLDAAPADFAETVNAVSAALTSDVVRAANNSVILEKEDSEDVAKDILSAAGLNK